MQSREVLDKALTTMKFFSRKHQSLDNSGDKNPLLIPSKPAAGTRSSMADQPSRLTPKAKQFSTERSLDFSTSLPPVARAPQYSYTMDSGEPVWKKRLKKAEADRRTLARRQGHRREPNQDIEKVSNGARPMRTISLSVGQDEGIDDNSCISQPSTQDAGYQKGQHQLRVRQQGKHSHGKAPPYVMSARASSLSGLTGNVSGFFRRVNTDDVFSLETPSCKSGETESMGSRQYTDDGDTLTATTSASSTLAESLQPRRSKSRSRSARRGGRRNDDETGCDLLLGGESSFADDFDLFARFVLGQISCATCMAGQHAMRKQPRKSGTVRSRESGIRRSRRSSV